MTIEELPEEPTHVYARVSGNVITNVVVATPSFAATQGYLRIDSLSPQPGPGWTRHGGSWQPPAPPGSVQPD
ncbi:hypothetical protein [Jatrophihabitans sp.]|uniref:hypothetical protein n=1 Tax=Jatrophihabitans sp. TaxID=1932789 RepID=UPI0030C772FB|nr:hypothetical protein [Jatrophihabitans sp.]